MSEGSDIKELLGEIKGKMDMCLANQNRMFDRVDSLEERLRHLEGHRSYLLGVVGAMSLAWVLVVEWLKAKVSV
jgi:hypothetical protein